MQLIREIGQPTWTREDIKNSLVEFMAIYPNRPIKDNDGGMKSPHLFATWFITKQLNPKHIIESGVWKGQGTWFMEQAAPQAQITCIDPVLDRITYKPAKATYQTKDFAKTDWKNIDKDKTLLFFDDHQNAFERLKVAKKMGFKHLLFEDNYPARSGDCYTLKKALMHAGFKGETPNPKGRLEKVKAIFSPPKAEIILPNAEDAAYLKNICKIYYEFPPIFKTETTRWNDAWVDYDYPTPLPILNTVTEPHQQIFYEEARFYTWFCYVQL
jgi:hypothetical protein